MTTAKEKKHINIYILFLLPKLYFLCRTATYKYLNNDW